MSEVLRVLQSPQTEKRDDGTWSAWYVGLDWSVTAATQPEAIADVQAEFRRRTDDPAFRDQLYTLAQHYLDHPEPGVVAEMITREDYERRTSPPFIEPIGTDTDTDRHHG